MAIGGLVDYNSSEDDDEQSGAPSTTHTGKSNDQPTLSSSSNQLPLPPPRKKQKQSKARILLDLPPIASTQPELKPIDSTSTTSPSNQDHAEPQSDLLSKLKRTKPNLSSTPSKKSGLAGMLPPPKRIQTTATSQVPSLRSISKVLETEEPKLKNSNVETSLKPSEEPIIKSDPTQSSSSSSSSSLPSTATESLNLFGLSSLEPNSRTAKSTTTTATTTTTTTADTIGTIKKSLAVSSAPQITEEEPPEPSLLDPYPGYWQRKDGTWVARDPEEPIWKAFYTEHYLYHHQDPSSQNQVTGNDYSSMDDDKNAKGGLPKDFFKDSPLGHPNLIDFDAQKVARTAWENKPKIIDPREEARREQEASMAAKPAKHASARARGRHQLSCLLTEAQSNRAELEDRIARGKLNRKAGGAKYGF